MSQAPAPPSTADPLTEPIPTAEANSSEPADPHNMGPALNQLLGGSRRAAKSSAMVVLAELADGETVEIVVACRFLGHDGVAVLTDRRLLLANGREWNPDLVSIDDLSDLDVEGWVERRAATVRLTGSSGVRVIDRINDTAVAETLTTALRSR